MEARHVYGAWSEASQCTPEVEVFPANSEGSNFLTIDMNSYHQPSKTQYDFVDMSYLLPDVDHAVDNEIIHQEKPTSQEFAQGSTISTSDTSLRDVSQPNSGVDWSLMSLVNTVGGSSHSLDTNTNDLNEQESSGRSEAQTTTISGGIPEMAKTPQGWTIRRTISSIDDVAVGSRKSPQKRSYDSMSGTDEFLKPHSSPMMVDCQVSWGITTSDSTIVSALSCNDGQDCHWTHAGSSILDAGTAVPPATPDDSMAPPPKPQRPALDTGSRQATVAVQSSLSTFVNAHERIYDSGSSTHSNSSLIDDIMLPPAAMQLETASKSNSFTNHDHRPQSKAASEASHSLTSSPAWLTLTSPQIQSPQTCSRTSRKDSAVQRVSSDRRWRTGAVSPSALVSPTVLPKISPNIAPMLTGKELVEAENLLATKSNYTHIVEGTRLPGLSYPESLSTALNVKRTTHKLAEQGRRNRMNDALKELQAILPARNSRSKSTSGVVSPSMTESGNAIDGDNDGISNGKNQQIDMTSPDLSTEAKYANSKAATVENAIQYINVLHKQQTDMLESMRNKDTEMNELRTRLNELQNL